MTGGGPGIIAGQPAQPQAQSLQQQPQQPGQPKPFTSQVVVTPDLIIDQNDKSLKVTGGTIDAFGQQIKLPALPFELPANPALNSLQAIYPGACSYIKLPAGHANAMRISLLALRIAALLRVLCQISTLSVLRMHDLTEVPAG